MSDYVPNPMASEEEALRRENLDLAVLDLEELREEHALVLVERARARLAGRRADYDWLRERSEAIAMLVARRRRRDDE